MKPKGRILIVEDEAILYERLRSSLTLENYEVGEFSPSFDVAIANLKTFMPDIVLLDVMLQGEKTGIDVGEVLNEKYKIPFVYLTEYDDDQTFYAGLNTKHAHFMVKTKPILNIKEVVRTIQTVLQNRKDHNIEFSHDGIFCLPDYLENIKNFNSSQISRIPVPFKGILFFSNRLEYPISKTKTERVKTNYIGVKTNDMCVAADAKANDKILESKDMDTKANDIDAKASDIDAKAKGKLDKLLVKCSLSELALHLPHYFARIDDGHILNLKSDLLKGKINGSRIVIGDETLTVSKIFKESFEKKLNSIYLNL